MRPRRRLLGLPVAALAGAVVMLPTVASSETSPTVEAIDKPGSGIYAEERHAWSPTQVTVAAGGDVTLRSPSATVPHGVRWVGGPGTPTCSGVPVGVEATASGTGWSGACTFAQAGTYTFYCTVHGAEMTGTVVVAAASSPTPVPTPMPAPTSTPTSSPGGPAPEGGPGSPLAGGASQAIKLPAGQGGRSVRGSVKLSQAAVGGHLQVDLLARGVSLAEARSKQVRVGRLVRSSLYAGTVPFSVSVSAKARRALTRHRRLALTVRIVLTPLHGAAVTITRGVLLRA